MSQLHNIGIFGLKVKCYTFFILSALILTPNCANVGVRKRVWRTMNLVAFGLQMYPLKAADLELDSPTM